MNLSHFGGVVGGLLPAERPRRASSRMHPARTPNVEPAPAPPMTKEAAIKKRRASRYKGRVHKHDSGGEPWLCRERRAGR